MLTFLYMYHHSLLLKSEAIEPCRAAQDVAWGHRTGGSAAWTHRPLGPATSFKITVGFLIVSLDSELYLCCLISSWSFKNSSPLKVLGFLVFCFKRNSSHASSKISSSFSNHLATPFSMLQPFLQSWQANARQFATNWMLKWKIIPKSPSHKNQKKTRKKLHQILSVAMGHDYQNVSFMFSSTIQAPAPCHPHILQCELLRGNLEVEPSSPPSGSWISFIGKVSTFFKSSGVWIFLDVLEKVPKLSFLRETDVRKSGTYMHLSCACIYKYTYIYIHSICSIYIHSICSMYIYHLLQLPAPTTFQFFSNQGTDIFASLSGPGTSYHRHLDTKENHQPTDFGRGVFQHLKASLRSQEVSFNIWSFCKLKFHTCYAKQQKNPAHVTTTRAAFWNGILQLGIAVSSLPNVRCVTYIV